MFFKSKRPNQTNSASYLYRNSSQANSQYLDSTNGLSNQSFMSNYSNKSRDGYKTILSTSNMGHDFYYHTRSNIRNRKLQQQFRNILYMILFGLFYHHFFYKQKNYPLIYGTFPPDFQWGVATSAYQIEGGFNEDGKSFSIWDEFTNKENSTIVDGSTGNQACDSYHKIHEDVQMLRKLNINYYRFSISWTRVIPDVDHPYDVNIEGLTYYNNLIDMLLSYNIEPFITLYHWDLPAKIQNQYGGWQNVSTADRFEEYSDIVFKAFSSKVKKFITFNEPRESTVGGYEIGYMAPGLKFAGYGAYNTSVTVLLAHAKAYRLYDRKYREHYGGKVGITLNCDWGEIRKPQDLLYQEAQNRYLQWYIGLFAHPIFLGDFPMVMKEGVRRKSVQQGLSESRLPTLSAEQIVLIKGTADFLGLNHYTTGVGGQICFANPIQRNLDL